MAEKTTFIKLDRNITRWRWFQDPNTVVVFLWLLTKANIEDHDFEGLTIHRGEVLASYNSICKGTGLSIRSTRTAINHLKSTGEVTSKAYPKYSVFTVQNYDKYQGGVTRYATFDRQASDKQATSKRQHLKNDKNIKNEKNKEKNKKESGAVSPLGGEPSATVEIESWEKELMEQQGWSYDELLEWKNQ